MKKILKIILALCIVNCALLIAQTSGFTVNVDKASTSYLTWKVPGDYTGYDSLHFVVKACTTSTACGQLIKKNCGVTYAKPHSTLTCTLYVEDTDDFNAAKYYFSIYAYGVDTVAVRSGTMNLQLNGQTPIDGVASTSPIYTIALSPPDEDTTFIVGFNSDSTWRELNIDDVRNVMGTGGGGGTNLEPELVVTPAESKIVMDVDSVRVNGRMMVKNSIGVGDYAVYGNSGLQLRITGIWQWNTTGYSFINYINNYNEDTGLGNKVIWGLTNSSGSGLTSYNLEPYSFGFNSSFGQPMYFMIGTFEVLKLTLSKITIGKVATWDVDLEINGDLEVRGAVVINDYTLPAADGDAGQFQRTDGNGNLYWANYSTGGSVGDADSLGGAPADTFAYKKDISDSLAGLRDWTSGLTTTSNLLKIGKPNRQIFFNNGAYSDFWLLDYIQHPYNLPYSNQIMREFRTDYYNDTLKTFQSIANLTFLDIVGSGIWHPDGFSYTHNQNALGVGDLPDSTTAVFNGSGVVGVQFQLQENNKTAGAKRFPMKVKGFEFKFSSTPYYTYPVVYGYYSDLTTNTPKLETAYHFYGLGDYPSYFPGIIQTDRTLQIMGEYSLPEIDGSDGQVIKTNGLGTLSWDDDNNDGVGGGIQDTVLYHNRYVPVDSLVLLADIIGDTSIFDINEFDSLLTILSNNDAVWTAKQAAISNLADTSKYVETTNINSLVKLDTLIGTTGNRSATTYLRGDNSWGTVTGSVPDSVIYPWELVDSLNNYWLAPAAVGSMIYSSNGTSWSAVTSDLSPALIQDSLTVKQNRSETSAWDKNAANDRLLADTTGSGGNTATRYQLLSGLATKDDSIHYHLFNKIIQSVMTLGGDTLYVNNDLNVAQDIKAGDDLKVEDDFEMINSGSIFTFETGNLTQTEIGLLDASDLALNLLQDSLTVKLNTANTSAWDKNAANDRLLADTTGSGGNTATRYQLLTGLAGYQPLEATLTDIADGTIAENLVNTANPWAANEVADAYILNTGDVGTGTYDLGGAIFEIPNSASDQTLANAGEFGINTTDEQLSVHSAADGEISGEVSIPIIQSYSISFDPKSVCDGTIDALYLFQVGDDFPEGIIIDEWKISFSQDPTVELDADLSRATAIIGQTSEADIDALDTLVGVAVEDADANINGGAVVANGQYIYIEFVTAYTAAGEQINFQMWYHGEED